ncbi:MAG: bifunctional DNA-formamidopyrimidine glycosylase/DNA-(apurinic or apyrimidinic site) lyase [Planctomycetaceae bacterium]
MPELPEVETMVRGIRQAVVGSVIVGYEPCPNSCRPLTVRPSLSRQSALCVGQTIVSVRRRAKRVLLELDQGWTFVIEPRMTGLMLLADPPDVGHLRVVWHLRSGGESRSLWFWDRRGLGTISLLNAAGLERAIGPHKLGPDALELTAADWRAICARTARPIKVALLDQKLVAGIGNLYASEMLFRAGISPLASACRLTTRQRTALQAACSEVLLEAIRYEGSTLSDGTYRNALNQSGGYQNAHRVYDREGEPCPACQAPISRIVQAQRATFYCPGCQSRGPRRGRK